MRGIECPTHRPVQCIPRCHHSVTAWHAISANRIDTFCAESANHCNTAQERSPEETAHMGGGGGGEECSRMTIVDVESHEARILHSHQLVQHALPTIARSPWLASPLQGCPPVHRVAKLARHASIAHRDCGVAPLGCATRTNLLRRTGRTTAGSPRSVAVSDRFSESMPTMWTSRDI